MMASKEWVVHKRLDDAKPLPRMPICRGANKITSSLVAYFWMLESYMKRPIYAENPPIKIQKEN
mgnify:CR=1 FL=1